MGLHPPSNVFPHGSLGSSTSSLFLSIEPPSLYWPDCLMSLCLRTSHHSTIPCVNTCPSVPSTLLGLLHPSRWEWQAVPKCQYLNYQSTFCNIQKSKDHTWKTVFQVIIFWVILPYRIINLLQCFWEMCCIHLQTDCIWFKWKLTWMGGGNESIIQGGYKDCCGSAVHKQWRERSCTMPAW